MELTITRSLDCKGLSCPLPILRTAKAIAQMEWGEVLEVLATDPGAVPDFNAWSRKTGHELIESNMQDGVYRFILRKTNR